MKTLTIESQWELMKSLLLAGDNLTETQLASMRHVFMMGATATIKLLGEAASDMHSVQDRHRFLGALMDECVGHLKVTMAKIDPRFQVFKDLFMPPTIPQLNQNLNRTRVQRLLGNKKTILEGDLEIATYVICAALQQKPQSKALILLPPPFKQDLRVRLKSFWGIQSDRYTMATPKAIQKGYRGSQGLDMQSFDVLILYFVKAIPKDAPSIKQALECIDTVWVYPAKDSLKELLGQGFSILNVGQEEDSA